MFARLGTHGREVVGRSRGESPGWAGALAYPLRCVAGDSFDECFRWAVSEESGCRETSREKRASCAPPRSPAAG